jgi:UDP-2,4-diacetamido-2,4,6-trideoxy-beta-L-altropyranose hydrolase
MGTGHVMRMIALGQAWKTLGGEVRFVGQTAPLTKRLEDEGFVCVPSAGAQGSEDDLAALMECTSQGQWVVLDGYLFDASYQQALRSRGRLVLVVDDVCNRQTYNADILLNQNPDAADYDYGINADCTRLSGTRYALIRKEFLAHAKAKPPPGEPVRHLLVTMGGSDPSGITAAAMEAIERTNDPSLKTRIIVGAANPVLPALREKARRTALPMELVVDTPDMGRHMAWADICMAAAGSTSWELCLFGIPTILFVVADNQAGIGRSLERQGAAVVMHPPVSTTGIATALKALIADRERRESMHATCTGIIDGKGAARVAGAMIRHGMTLRPVTADDSDTLLRWRNDPSVRSRSFQSDIVPHKQHEAWFAAKLVDPDCLFYMAVDRNGTPMGQVRFDRSEPNSVVSLNVAPELVGMDIGTAMLHTACEKMRQEWPGTGVVALVKADNAPSARMFIKAGFARADVPDGSTLRFEWPGRSNE